MLEYGYRDEIPEPFQGATVSGLRALQDVCRNEARLKDGCIQKVDETVRLQTEEISLCHARIEELRTQRDTFKQSLRALQNSPSWKVTKPLRSLLRRLGGS